MSREMEKNVAYQFLFQLYSIDIEYKKNIIYLFNYYLNNNAYIYSN